MTQVSKTGMIKMIYDEVIAQRVIIERMERNIQEIYDPAKSGNAITVTFGKPIGNGKNQKRITAPKKFKFTKEQDKYINDLFENDVSICKLGSNRTKYLHFLYDMKLEKNILIQYNATIDKHIKKTMEIKKCGLSDACTTLGMKTKNTSKGDGEKWEERTIDMYDYKTKPGSMISITTGKDNSKIKKLNLTAFIGRKWTEFKNKAIIPETDSRYETDYNAISKSKRIIMKYENKKKAMEEKATEIMIRVKKKMTPQEFGKHFPAWGPQPSKTTNPKQRVDKKSAKNNKTTKKQKPYQDDEALNDDDGGKDETMTNEDDDDNVLQNVGMDELGGDDEDLDDDLFDI